MFRKIFGFVKKVAVATWNTVVDTAKDIFNNAEAAVILTAAAIGTTAVLTELPFHIAVPAIIEAPVVLPIVSTVIVLGLIYSMQFRLRRQGVTEC